MEIPSCGRAGQIWVRTADCGERNLPKAAERPKRHPDARRFRASAFLIRPARNPFHVIQTTENAKDGRSNPPRVFSHPASSAGDRRDRNSTRQRGKPSRNPRSNEPGSRSSPMFPCSGSNPTGCIVRQVGVGSARLGIGACEQPDQRCCGDWTRIVRNLELETNGRQARKVRNSERIAAFVFLVRSATQI